MCCKGSLLGFQHFKIQYLDLISLLPHTCSYVQISYDICFVFRGGHETILGIQVKYIKRHSNQSLIIKVSQLVSLKYTLNSPPTDARY